MAHFNISVSVKRHRDNDNLKEKPKWNFQWKMMFSSDSNKRT